MKIIYEIVTMYQLQSFFEKFQWLPWYGSAQYQLTASLKFFEHAMLGLIWNHLIWNLDFKSPWWFYDFDLKSFLAIILDFKSFYEWYVSTLWAWDSFVKVGRFIQCAFCWEGWWDLKEIWRDSILLLATWKFCENSTQEIQNMAHLAFQFGCSYILFLWIKKDRK